MYKFRVYVFTYLCTRVSLLRFFTQLPQVNGRVVLSLNYRYCVCHLGLTVVISVPRRRTLALERPENDTGKWNSRCSFLPPLLPFYCIPVMVNLQRPAPLQLAQAALP